LETEVADLRNREAALKAKNETDAVIASELKAKQAEFDLASAQIKSAQLEARNAALEGAYKARREADAKAAVEEGIVPGGGVALIQAGAKAFAKLKLTGDEATGANIVRVAIESPLRQIAINAGLEAGVVVDKVRSLPDGHGLNAATGEYEDLVKLGVIDAAKVTRSALQNAASIAALFLTTEAVVADKPEAAGNGGGMGGGMEDF
jgi:hypothetical protein